MSTVVAILMKDFAESKTRLAGALAAAEREGVALALFRRVQTFFAMHFPDFERLVVTPSSRVAIETTACGAIPLMEEGESGLNRAAQSAFVWAKNRGGNRLLVVPADIPLWLRSEVEELLDEGTNYDLVVARAHDGGTNALLIDLARADRFEFCYGPDLAKRHGDAALAVGLRSLTRHWSFLGHDIDTVSDWLVLSQKLSGLRDAIPNISNYKERPGDDVDLILAQLYAEHKVPLRRARFRLSSAGRVGRAEMVQRTGIELIALPDVPTIKPGDDLVSVIKTGFDRLGLAPADGDIIVLAQKIVSKAEDRFVDLTSVKPSPAAETLAVEVDKDARLVELICLNHGASCATGKIF